MGDWSFNEQAWPDPKAMVDECRSYGMEIMVSVWAFTCPGSRSYDMLVNNSWVTTLVGEDGKPLVTLHEKGDYFGEVALIRSEPRSASVVTATSATVAVVKGATFRDLFLTSPAAAAESRRGGSESRRGLRGVSLPTAARARRTASSAASRSADDFHAARLIIPASTPDVTAAPMKTPTVTAVP